MGKYRSDYNCRIEEIVARIPVKAANNKPAAGLKSMTGFADGPFGYSFQWDYEDYLDYYDLLYIVAEHENENDPYNYSGCYWDSVRASAEERSTEECSTEAASAPVVDPGRSSVFCITTSDSSSSNWMVTGLQKQRQRWRVLGKFS